MPGIIKEHVIEILSLHIEEKSDSATGRKWDALHAMCLISGVEGGDQPVRLNLPMSLQDTVPGKYYAELGLQRTFNRNLLPGVVRLHKVPDGPGADQLESQG